MKQNASKSNGRPSDSLPFPLADPIDLFIADAVPRMPTPARWAAFNAIRHLKRAWLIREIDHAMAVLRCITAEEEAATALFRALRRRKYEHSEALDAHNHLHKNAAYPFLEAIQRTMSVFAAGMPQIQIIVDQSKARPRLALRHKLVERGTGKKFWAYPQPPLNFLMETGRVGQPGKREDFAEGVRQIVAEASAGSVRDYLRARANDRNRLLYATKGGYYEVQLQGDQGFEIYRRRVFALLKAYMFVDQYKTHQLFVQQALDAFVLVVDSSFRAIYFD